MRVAFMGLGIMGSRMGANLARKGFELTVWNRTAATAAAFRAEHPEVSVAATPADAADGAEVIITMVVDSEQVRRVLLGEDRPGALARGWSVSVGKSRLPVRRGGQITPLPVRKGGQKAPVCSKVWGLADFFVQSFLPGACCTPVRAQEA